MLRFASRVRRHIELAPSSQLILSPNDSKRNADEPCAASGGAKRAFRRAAMSYSLVKAHIQRRGQDLRREK